MTIKNSKHVKSIWAKMSKEQRSAEVSRRVTLMWSKRSKTQRKKHIEMMNKARKEKLCTEKID